jgi:hypothetical protein
MGAAQFIVWSVALGRAKETEIQNRGRRFGPPLSRKRNQIVCAMLAGGRQSPPSLLVFSAEPPVGAAAVQPGGLPIERH